MLSKKQLEDTAKCGQVQCRHCKLYISKENDETFIPRTACIEFLAQAALAYRAMLEKAYVLLNDHYIEQHYSSAGEMTEVEKFLKELAALLKESEGLG